MKVVCDTDVLVAALVAEGLCRKFRVEPRDVPFLKIYRERAELVKPERLKRAVRRDPDDDLVLATAVAAKAHCILTGDNDLLVLRSFAGIAILSPRAFVDAMDRGT